jgi:hypothetical protein
MRLTRRVWEDILAQLTQQVIERDRVVRRRRRQALAGIARQTVRQHPLLTQRRQVVGDSIRDLAAEPLHRRVIEIERRGRTSGHGEGEEGNRMILARLSTNPAIWRRSTTRANDTAVRSIDEIRL